MLDLEIIFDELEISYREALNQAFQMHFSVDFPDQEKGQKVLRGTIQNVEEITHSYENLKKALQHQNLKGLQGYGQG